MGTIRCLRKQANVQAVTPKLLYTKKKKLLDSSKHLHHVNKLIENKKKKKTREFSVVCVIGVPIKQRRTFKRSSSCHTLC